MGIKKTVIFYDSKLFMPPKVGNYSTTDNWKRVSSEFDPYAPVSKLPAVPVEMEDFWISPLYFCIRNLIPFWVPGN